MRFDPRRDGGRVPAARRSERGSGQELSDNALEAVAGGFKDHNCNDAKGGINTHVEFKLA